MSPQHFILLSPWHVMILALLALLARRVFGGPWMR
jgi:hypothetical protein